MKQFFQHIIAEYPISFESLIIWVKLILSTAISYVMGRYASNNPRHKAINQEQLEKVYLPLYKLLFVQDISKLDCQSLIKLSNRMQIILRKHYELVFPQLHQLTEDFYQALLLKQNHQEILRQIKYQVYVDYESLKRKLGYPHINAFELFRRKTLIDKIRTIWGYLFLLYLFPGAFLSAAFSPVTWSSLLFYCIGFCIISYIGVQLGSKSF